MNTDEYPLVNEHSYGKWHLKHHDHHDNQSIIQRATFNFSLDFAPGDLALVDHVDGSAKTWTRVPSAERHVSGWFRLRGLSFGG